MITSDKNYTKINIKIRSQLQTANPKSTVAPKVHRLNFGMIRCLFRYSRDAGYLKLIVGILSAAPEAAGRDFPFSSLLAQLLGFSFGFGPTSACGLPSGFCSHPDRMGLKQWLIRVLWLIHAGGGERRGYSSYNGNAGRAFGGRGWRDVATAMCSPGEVVPGSRDPGSGGLHRLVGGWGVGMCIVTCACTQDSWWLQQQR